MISRIGANVQANAVDDWGKTLDYWSALNPSTMVITINSLNDKNRIFEAQQRLPNTLVVARYVLIVNSEEFDGKLHTKPEAVGDTNYYLVSPEHYMNLIEPLASQGSVLYWGNEPSGEVGEITFDRLIKHTVEGIALAEERKHSLCVFNWGVGHPTLTPSGDQLDPRIKPVIQAIADAKQRHYYGMHLYAPADTHVRLEALENSCKEWQLPMPPVIVTEHGFDAGYGGDPLNGYKSRGMSGEAFARWQVEAVKGTYRRFIEEGKLVGLTTFSWGGNPRWKQFNVEPDSGYKDAIETAFQQGELNLQKRTTQTIPKFFPGIKPANAEYPHPYKLALPKDTPLRNLRALPEEASDKVMELYNGDQVIIYDSPAEHDALMRKWQWCEVGNKSGWVYVGGILLSPVLPDVVVPPAPVVVPPAPVEQPPVQPPVTIPVGCPETFNTTISVDQWVKIAKKMRAIQAAIGDLAELIESIVPEPQTQGV